MSISHFAKLRYGSAKKAIFHFARGSSGKRGGRRPLPEVHSKIHFFLDFSNFTRKHSKWGNSGSGIHETLLFSCFEHSPMSYTRNEAFFIGFPSNFTIFTTKEIYLGRSSLVFVLSSPFYTRLHIQIVREWFLRSILGVESKKKWLWLLSENWHIAVAKWGFHPAQKWNLIL